MPYGWQFVDETVFIAAQKGFRLNCWGLISRDNECHWQTTTRSINARFVSEALDAFSFCVHLPTVVVLDNASVHTATLIQERRAIWAQRAGPPVRAVFIFSASLQSPPKHCRDFVATPERGLVGAGRLFTE